MHSTKTTHVAILGAECTGKTTLCAALKKLLLEEDLDAKIVPEALRKFCIEHNRVPQKEDQMGIMYEQMKLSDDDEATTQLSQHTVTLSDCAPITIAIYSELYFSDPSLYLEAEKFHSRYQLSILLSPTIGWQRDSIFRESPMAQEHFHRRLKQWLQSNTYPWLEIHDVGAQRTVSAINAIIPLLR